MLRKEWRKPPFGSTGLLLPGGALLVIYQQQALQGSLLVARQQWVLQSRSLNSCTSQRLTWLVTYLWVASHEVLFGCGKWFH